MLSYEQAFHHLKQSLHKIYDERESASIAHELMEHITGSSKLHRLAEKEKRFTALQEDEFHSAEKRLLSGEPMQYITGTAWFMGMPFTVNKNVLIPRPETEELVQWIIDDWKEKKEFSILDIGTGSGCIPVALKLSLRDAIVEACDISRDALDIAASNAARLNAEVLFFQTDILSSKNWEMLQLYDVIVSNPPYIPESEKESLDINVRDHEPGIALFTPTQDPLLFYRAIADFGKKHLKKDGAIYCELHRDHAEATRELFSHNGYAQVELRKDMHGNFRMLKSSSFGFHL